MVVRSYLRDEDTNHLIFVDLRDERRELGYFVDFVDAKYSLDNQFVAILSQDGHYVVLLDAKTLREVGMIHSETPIIDFQLHPESQMISLIDEKYHISFYDVPDLLLHHTVQLVDKPWRLSNLKAQFSSDGRYISVVYDEGGVIWDLTTFEQVHQFEEFDYREWYFWSADYPTELRRVQRGMDATIIASRDTVSNDVIIRTFRIPIKERGIGDIGQFVKFMDNGDALFFGMAGYPLTAIMSFP